MKAFTAAFVALMTTTSLGLAPAALAKSGVAARDATGTDSVTLADIVVTAQKRQENLQQVPITVTVFDASLLNATGAVKLEDVALLTPGFQGYGTNGIGSPHLRGIGTQAAGVGADNAVAMYVDGVYLGANSRGLLTLNQIDQIQILKGPQGTLFGRNATAGVIDITTRKPTATEAELRIGYENYDTVTGSAYLSYADPERFSTNVSAQIRKQGKGWGKNLFTGEDIGLLDKDVVLYSKSIFHATENTDFQLTLDHEDQRGPLDPNYVVAGTRYAFGQVGTNSRDINRDVQPMIGMKGTGIALQGNHEFSGVTLTSITAFRKDRVTGELDADLTTLPLSSIVTDVKEKQFTQELRLASNKGSRLNWVVGSFFLHSNSPYFLAFDATDASGVTRIASSTTQKTSSISAFAQATYAVAEATSITGGIRITKETKRINSNWLFTLPGGIDVPGENLPGYAPVRSKATFTAPTWRIALDHRFSQDVMGYISYNRGFKSGGYNLAGPTSPPYSEEKLDAYEVGLKSMLFGRRVRANASAFYYDYKDIQVYVYRPGIGAQVYNGPAATLYGLDFDLDARVSDRLSLFGGVELLKSKFGDFPDAIFSDPLPGGGYTQGPRPGGAKGNQLPFAPKFTGVIGATYTMPSSVGRFELSGSYAYNSGFYAEVDNGLRQGAFPMVTSSLTWFSRDDRFNLRLWGKNLTNADYSEVMLTTTLGAARTRNSPRMYGVTLTAKM